MTNCPYSGKCSSEGAWCSSCKHNADAKQNHYEPITIWYPSYYEPYIIYSGTAPTTITPTII